MAKLFTGENIVVGVDEIENMKKQANELYMQGMFQQSIIGEAPRGNPPSFMDPLLPVEAGLAESRGRAAVAVV